MRATTEQLSQVTNLLALVSAPPIETATIHRVEVLLLQPQVAMVVVITSTGGVTKRVISYDEPLDPGLVDWAGQLPQRGAGRHGRRARGCCRRRLTDPELGERERAFLQTLSPAFTELEDSAGDTLFVEGAARLLSEHRFQELPQLSDLMEALERRVALLAVMRASLSEPNVYLRIGRENPAPELRSLSMVAANYGLARRNLGAGERARPGAAWTTRGDHRRAPGGRRAVAVRGRGLRRMRRDAYEVLGVARGADEREVKKRLPGARARAAPRRERARPRGRGEVQGGRRGLRGAVGPRAQGGVRPLRLGRPGLARLRAPVARLRLVRRHLRGVLRRRSVRRRPRARAPCRAATSAWRSRSPWPRPPPESPRRSAFDAVETCEPLPRQSRRARHADRDLRALRRQRAAARGHPHRLRPAGARPGLRRLRRRGQGGPHALHRVRRRGQARRAAHARGGPARRHRRRAAHAARGPRPRGRARRPARRPLRAGAPSPTTSASCATAATWSRWSTCPRRRRRSARR